MMRQLNIFETITYNIVKPVKLAMVQAVKLSGLSREEIVDGMNELAEQFGVNLIKGSGKRLTVDTLEKWLNPNDRTRVINLKSLPIFCRIVKDNGAIVELVRPLGGMLIDEQDARLLAWAKQYHRAKEARRAMKRIEEDL